MKFKEYISHLKTVKNFASDNKVSRAYVYKIINQGKLQTVIIDGVIFIDIIKYPTIHAK
jgi:hypothetical protein